MCLLSLFSNPDFQLNLIAEAFGVIAETILIYLIISRVLAAKESKRWRPARINVVKRLVEVQRNLFNASRHIIDPDFHVDKKLHNVPEQASQEAANYWGKRVFLPPLEPDLNKLKKMVEYNNSALDSTLMPLVSDFLISAETLLNTTKFLIEAYDPETTNQHTTSAPFYELRKMEEICTSIREHYPEATTENDKSAFIVLSADEMIKLFIKASEQNSRIDLVNIGKV